MRTIKTRRVEHFKVADFSYAELEHEIIQEGVAEKDAEKVQAELDVLVHDYFKTARQAFKKMIKKGEFDLV